jgi:amino acid transporter
MEATRREPEVIQARIGLWDAVSIIIGIIIGVGIFETPMKILRAAPGPWEALGVWALSGLLPVVGALCFAELASTYPQSGGEYVYLTRAFGPRIGFLYAWAQLAVIRPASIAAVAYILAEKANVLWGLGAGGMTLLAAGAIAALTLINVLGVTLGKRTQNVLTLAKVLALVAIGAAGFIWAQPHAESEAPWPVQSGWLGKAMVLALWTYSGWHEAAYVAAEVKNSRRNLPLALLLGTIAVTLIYLMVNGAILVGLGFDAARQSQEVAVDLLRNVLDQSAGTAINVVVMVSALGAINGMIFTTARIYAVFGEDHRLFAPLGRWSRRYGTPVRSLCTGGILSIVFVLVVDLTWGEAEGFDTLAVGTAAVFWLFFLLTGIGLFILRWKDSELARPFAVPLYPLLPFLFCAACAAMVFASIYAEPELSLIGLGILLTGLPFCFVGRDLEATRAAEVKSAPAKTEELRTAVQR